MLKAILARQIDRFERLWGYDAGYMRQLLAASPISFIRFSLVSGMVDAKAAPAEAIAAAKLVGTLAEDCGPCTQIVIDMAEAQGVSAQVLRALLAGEEAAMGTDAGLTWRFARASLARDMETADPLRDEIVARWGGAGLNAISLALTTGRMYPTLKYALGHGKACSRVVVECVAAPVARAPLAA